MLVGAKTIALWLVIAFLPATAIAQETVNYASVSGRVTDATGAGLKGAQVTARHRETNVTGSTTTDEHGRFRFAYLRVGPYEVAIRANGFAPVVSWKFTVSPTRRAPAAGIAPP